MATAVLEELNVNVVATLAFAEFTADAERASTCPATSEAVAGDTLTCATVVLAEEEPLPQPARKAVKTKTGMTAILAVDHEAEGPERALFPRLVKVHFMNINIEECSV